MEGWSMESEGTYYSRRAQEEREAAMKAAHPKARQAHLELAEAYEGRTRAVAANLRRSAMRLVSAA
jgi:hypothetical protein